jgi:hypothetical protein
MQTDPLHQPPAEKLIRLIADALSRKAAIVNRNQWSLDIAAPTGRQKHGKRSAAPVGLETKMRIRSRGLHPWLLTTGPLGLNAVK